MTTIVNTPPSYPPPERNDQGWGAAAVLFAFVSIIVALALLFGNCEPPRSITVPVNVPVEVSPVTR